MLPSATNILSVTQLNRLVRGLLEQQIGEVWVEGEVSNLRKQSSGHHYFTLKDASAQLSCVLFRGAHAGMGFPRLADGAHVQLLGELTVYEARGQYQLMVRFLQSKGLGALQAKFEALKRALDAQGLFDPAEKKLLPPYPARLLIITSPDGAAIRDVLHVLSRRAPWIEVLIAPVRVQGLGAAQEIVAALEYAPRFSPDVVLVTRGGGSLEDMWPFNEEIVARAIHACPLPVVSAVGHEIDFTISDFVADVRAATPSAAAEIISPGRDDIRQLLAGHNRHLAACLREKILRLRNRLHQCRLLEREPVGRIASGRQYVDELGVALARLTTTALQLPRQKIGDLHHRLRSHRPDAMLRVARQSLARLDEQLAERSGSLLMERSMRLEALADRLRLLGPASVLQRGFTLALDKEGRVLRSVGAARTADTFITRFHDGDLATRVSENSSKIKPGKFHRDQTDGDKQSDRQAEDKTPPK